MIAQVVFDLPLDGPFDYLIPEHLASSITVGRRVKVSFGPKTQMGFVIGVLAQSEFLKLKPIQSLCDSTEAFNSLDLVFARDFSAYYGCSLGEALGTILRNKTDLKPSIRQEKAPQYSLYQCRPEDYSGKIQQIMDSYPQGAHFLILVPDLFRAQMLSLKLKQTEFIKIGMRSAVFEADGRYRCVIMVDEADLSYKQEQTPMYETRQVLLRRSAMFGFDAAFVGLSPSVELMALVRENPAIKFTEEPLNLPAARLIDLTNYKFIPGLISPPVRDALDAALKAGKKSILVLNRRGSYRLTRCVDCGEVLKCSHCDSALIYSRSEGKFLCRHCTYTAPGDTVCPKCHKPSWRSQGLGVEQLQTELKKHFPGAKILAFERSAKTAKKDIQLNDFDILISTQAVLRFQGHWQVQVAAFMDFDAELNRLDMHAAFNAVSLALHMSSMAAAPLLIQTRNIHHYVLQSLAHGDIKSFYDQELKLRKEFGFSPFKHWVKISWRGKVEKATLKAAHQGYDALSQKGSEGYAFTPPLADAIGRKRNQFRFNVMAQAPEIYKVMTFIKSTFATLKRSSKVIMTMEIDP